MTVTIHSILNSVLWGGLLAGLLSFLSRNRRFLCRFGAAPLALLTVVCFLRCCLPLEFPVTKEIGAATLNPLHRIINRAAGSVSPEPWFWRIWLAGSGLALVLWLPRYALRLFAAARLPETEDARIRKVCGELGLDSLRVVVTARAHTPCVTGLRRETVLLPDTQYTYRQLEIILRHEYAHIKHHDGLLDLALCLLWVLFWWNPGVLVCRAVVIRLCDHRCDLETLQSASPSAKRFYCRTLLAFASRSPGPTRHFAAASLKSRFYLILYGNTKVRRASLLAIGIIMLILLVVTYLVILQPAFQPEETGYYFCGQR